MAKTKDDIRAEGRQARLVNAENPFPGTEINNPYKPDSWQANAWSDGYRAGTKWLDEQLARHKAEAGRGQSIRDIPANAVANLPRDTVGGVSVPFPARMPAATREHIRRLEASQASKLADGSYLIRTAKKIEKLYAKWA